MEYMSVHIDTSETFGAGKLIFESLALGGCCQRVLRYGYKGSSERLACSCTTQFKQDYEKHIGGGCGPGMS